MVFELEMDFLPVRFKPREIHASFEATLPRSVVFAGPSRNHKRDQSREMKSTHLPSLNRPLGVKKRLEAYLCQSEYLDLLQHFAIGRRMGRIDLNEQVTGLAIHTALGKKGR